MSHLQICHNCGKQGHYIHQCKIPITSCGIIAVRQMNNEYEYLMIRRKHSFGYIDFMRGNYDVNNLFQIQGLIDEMSMEEKQNILTIPFEKLSTHMWSKNRDFTNAISKKKKLEEHHLLHKMIHESTTKWMETEWEFPKGRKNDLEETDLHCAIREFQEETGITINIIENMLFPFEETFVGTNLKSYKHKYFLGIITTNVNLTNFQRSEVSNLQWKSLSECISSIRPYNLEKINLITNINKLLEDYCIIYINEPK